MANKPSRRRRGRLLKGNVDDNLTVGALTALDVISTIFDNVVDERSFLLSMEAVWGQHDATIGEGPVVVGVAHSDYSAAEIEEWLEVTGSWNEGDLVELEIGLRGKRIRIVGAFPMATSDEVLNDGKPIKTKLGFIVNQGQSFQIWAYNKSEATFTTGMILTTNGHCWVKPQ